ncbi:MAG: restriction endonuclease [Bacteroidota bacterium]|nr:restriction endonuclease [Bacteroidota bacterium]
MAWEDYIPEDIQTLYEVYDFHHAAAILATEFKTEFDEICEALRNFSFSQDDITTSGGNESQIPKKFSKLLRPNWLEKKMEAKLVVDNVELNIDTHKVDYIKGRVAFDLEWNSKDQTFDRDLYAFRAFFEYNKISVGVLVTRSLLLDDLFINLGIRSKYGASTTHIGKLLYRLAAGRNGGCPVLVFGITPNSYEQ